MRNVEPVKVENPIEDDQRPSADLLTVNLSVHDL